MLGPENLAALAVELPIAGAMIYVIRVFLGHIRERDAEMSKALAQMSSAITELATTLAHLEGRLGDKG